MSGVSEHYKVIFADKIRQADSPEALFLAVQEISGAPSLATRNVANALLQIAMVDKNDSTRTIALSALKRTVYANPSVANPTMVSMIDLLVGSESEKISKEALRLQSGIDTLRSDLAEHQYPHALGPTLALRQIAPRKIPGPPAGVATIATPFFSD